MSRTLTRAAPWLLLFMIATVHALLVQDDFDYRVAVIVGRVLLAMLAAAGLLGLYVLLHRIIRRQPPRDWLVAWGVLAVISLVALELLQWALR